MPLVVLVPASLALPWRRNDILYRLVEGEEAAPEPEPAVEGFMVEEGQH